MLPRFGPECLQQLQVALQLLLLQMHFNRFQQFFLISTRITFASSYALNTKEQKIMFVIYFTRTYKKTNSSLFYTFHLNKSEEKIYLLRLIWNYQPLIFFRVRTRNNTLEKKFIRSTIILPRTLHPVPDKKYAFYRVFLLSSCYSFRYKLLPTR